MNSYQSAKLAPGTHMKQQKDNGMLSNLIQCCQHSCHIGQLALSAAPPSSERCFRFLDDTQIPIHTSGKQPILPWTHKARKPLMITYLHADSGLSLQIGVSLYCCKVVMSNVMKYFNITMRINTNY